MTLAEDPSTKSTIGSTIRRFFAAHGLGLAAGALVAAASIGLYLGLVEDEGQLIYRTVAAVPPRLELEMTDALRVRSLALREIADRWEKRPADQKAWASDIDGLLSKNLQFRGIQWFEPSLESRWSWPVGVRLPHAALDSSGDAIRVDELRALLSDAEPTYSRSFPLPDAPRQMLLCAPMKQDGKVTGYLVGMLRVNDLVDAMIGDLLERGYSLSVNEGAFHLYGPVWLEGGDESTFGSEGNVRMGDLDWQLTVWPSAESLRDLRSRLPLIALVAGLLLALLLGIAVDRHRHWKRRALGLIETTPEPIAITDAETGAPPGDEPGAPAAERSEA